MDWPASGQFQADCFLGLPMPKAQQLNITHQIYHCVLTKKEACCSNIAIRNGCCSHTDHKVDDKTAITLLLVEQLDALHNHHISLKNYAVLYVAIITQSLQRENSRLELVNRPTIIGAWVYSKMSFASNINKKKRRKKLQNTLRIIDNFLGFQ